MHGRIVGNRTAVVVALAAVVVVSASVYAVARRAGSTSVASLRESVNATIMSGSGSRTPARAGDSLPIGSRLVTSDAAGSNAQVTIGERMLWLGVGTSVLRDGLRSFTLDRGSIIGGGNSGVAVTIRSDETLVSPATASIWRVDRGFITRVATYWGRVHVLTDSGSEIDVPALHQASAAGSSLPPSPGPLQLTPGDLRERTVEPALVSVDGYLSRVAAGLDGHNERGTQVAAAVARTFKLSPATAVEPVSERVVPAVIAQATASARVTSYQKARSLRADGGSWGVVAVLAGAAKLPPLQHAVAALLDLTANATPATPTEQGTAGETTGSTSGTTPTVTPPPGGQPQPGQNPTPTHPGTTVTPTPTPTATGDPTSDPGLLGGLLDVLNGLLSPSPKAIR